MALNPDSADKRGYLKEPFRLFSLKDHTSSENIPTHYHEFHKLIFFFEGNLTYQVEGRNYELRPGDALLIPAHAIHRPIIGTDAPYARSIFWIQPNALEGHGLDGCFVRCTEENSHLLPKERYDRRLLKQILRDMDQAKAEQEFGSGIMLEALFLQLMVYVNRWLLSAREGGIDNYARVDPKIDEILEYINQNLSAELGVDELAGRFFLSRSWLMHRFKEITGCPVHQYILQKRLICATEYLRKGESVGIAARNSGFSDYSAFLRAFRKTYGISPRDFR